MQRHTYIHTYMYTCSCVCIHTYTYMHMPWTHRHWLCSWTCACVYEHTWTWIHINSVFGSQQSRSQHRCLYILCPKLKHLLFLHTYHLPHFSHSQRMASPLLYEAECLRVPASMLLSSGHGGLQGLHEEQFLLHRPPHTHLHGSRC